MYYMNTTQTKASPREIIEGAGHRYPINWNEMGSSEKDLWEERMLRSIHRRQRRNS